MTGNEGAAPMDPSPIMELTTGYWASQAFLTANRIGLFEALAEGPLSPGQVAESLSLGVRPTDLLLKACTALGLLDTDGAGYRNSALSQAFLVPGSPGYLGNAARFTDDLYDVWGGLERSLREDRPVLAEESYLGDDDERTRHFVYGMHDRALGVSRALVEIVDLSGRESLLDVGGGPGTYSALLVKRFPHLRSQVLELPGVARVAEEIVASLGAAEKVTMVPGDYLESAFPQGMDVVLMSGMFHRETPETCQMLIGKAWQALAPGGLLVVSDIFTDAGGAGPPFATLFGLTMLLTAPHGGVHADADVARWLEEQGFGKVEIRPFPRPMPHRVVMGEKEK